MLSFRHFLRFFKILEIRNTYVHKIFRKTYISYPLIQKRKCAYQGVRNVSFSENFANVLNEWFLSDRRLTENEIEQNITHCLKSVQIRSYFWSVFSCIRTEYRKIRNRNNSVFGHFSRSVGSLKNARKAVTRIIWETVHFWKKIPEK